MDFHDTKSPSDRRSIRESKVRSYLDLHVNPSNMLFFCRSSGINIPKTVEFEDFDGWISEYLEGLSDDELISLMRRFEITIVMSDADEWEGIFVIHSSRDVRYANAITRGLNFINIPDTSIYCSSVEGLGTKAGESFHKVIKQCLRNAKLILCILSENSATSQYCLQEMGACMVMDVPIIPVLVDGFLPEDMPGFMDNTRYQAVTLGTVRSSESFINDVCHKLGISPSAVDVSRAVQSIVQELS